MVISRRARWAWSGLVTGSLLNLSAMGLSCPGTSTLYTQAKAPAPMLPLRTIVLALPVGAAALLDASPSAFDGFGGGYGGGYGSDGCGSGGCGSERVKGAGCLGHQGFPSAGPPPPLAQHTPRT